MTANQWLRVSVPMQGLLLLSQLTTGLNADRIPDRVYGIMHIGGGTLLALLVVIHVIVNWDWVRKNYLPH